MRFVSPRSRFIAALPVPNAIKTTYSNSDFFYFHGFFETTQRDILGTSNYCKHYQYFMLRRDAATDLRSSLCPRRLHLLPSYLGFIFRTSSWRKIQDTFLYIAKYRCHFDNVHYKSIQGLGRLLVHV